MSVTASGFYGLSLEKMMIDTLAISLESETDIKGLLVTDSETPNFTTHDFRNDITAECSGTGYSTGGADVTGTDITLSSGTLTWTYTDPQWTSSTIPLAMAHISYTDTGNAATDCLLLLLDFVTAVSTTNGTLTVDISASGAMTLDYTP